MKHQKAWACFFLAAALITAAMIFYFSAQKAVDSAALSDQITLRIAPIIRPDYFQLAPEVQRSYLELLSSVIRENAHFCEFMLLGFNLMAWLRLRDPSAPVRRCRLWAWGIATAYAVTDELHQLFVSERVCQVVDMLIDSAGGLVGTFVAVVFLSLMASLQKRHASN